MADEIQINLHPVNFVIISGIIQCIILAGVLIFYKKGNRLANRFFGLFIFICSLHVSWTLIVDTKLENVFSQILWFPYSYLLAIGPLLFLYIKSLTEFGFKISLKDLIHFLPVLVEILVHLYFIKESITYHKPFYEVTGFLILKTIEFTTTGISIMIYGTRCLALIRTHEIWLLQNFSNQKNVTLSWLINLIKYLKVLWIFWLAFEISFLLFWKFQLHLIPVYVLLYVLLGVVTYSTYWIGIQGLIKSEVFAESIVHKSLPTETSNAYANLSESELQSSVDALDQLMQKEKLYLHETLTLRTLAGRLQKDPNFVSYLLNNTLNKSFFDYVNELRIEEVKSKINDPAFSHFKVVEIAYECGFNSKATFNRVFKKFTGTSPSEYKKGQFDKIVNGNREG